MPDVFSRIDAELARKGQTDAWLARQLGIERAAIANWRRRGVVPKGRYDEIAVALGQTADWLAGRAPAREAGSTSPTQGVGAFAAPHRKS